MNQIRLYRFIVMLEFKNFYIVKTFYNKLYKVYKCQKKLVVGGDYNVYAHSRKSFIIKNLIIVDDKKAGVITR